MGLFSNWFGGNKDPHAESPIPNTRVTVSHEATLKKLNEESGKPLDEKSDWAESAEVENRVEKAIRDSGCWDHHLAVVECMGERRDWRLCQDQLQGFKECMTKKSVENATRPKITSNAKQ